MALGELYQPKGLALETARFVLQVKCPYACNVAMGCPNGCLYCYGANAFKKKDWTCVRYPAKPPVVLVKNQILKGKLQPFPEGVFIPFATDPWHNEEVSNYTSDLASYLLRNNVSKVAVLSKLKSKPRHIFPEGYIHGMTIVSMSKNFQKKWEPNADPVKVRIKDCLISHAFGKKTFASLEPLPCPSIHKINLVALLEKIKFVDMLIMGKWNYNKKASTDKARTFYQDACWTFRDWCKANGKDWHIKSPTLKFCGFETYPQFDERDGE